MDDQTATGQLSVAAKPRTIVTDKQGRVIAIQKLTLLNHYQLSKVMGDLADNDRTMNMAIIASAVTRIDTTDFTFPTKEADIRFVLQLLDFNGFEAAAEGFKQANSTSQDTEELAKNSPGDQDSR
jgi:hypothetical protein